MKKMLAITLLSAALCGSTIASDERDREQMEERYTNLISELVRLRLSMVRKDPTSHEYSLLKLQHDGLVSEQQRLARDLGYPTRQTTVVRVTS